MSDGIKRFYEDRQLAEAYRSKEYADSERKQFLRYLLMCATHDKPFDLKAHVPRIKRLVEADEQRHTEEN